jgi:hypothetical protein
MRATWPRSYHPKLRSMRYAGHEKDSYPRSQYFRYHTTATGSGSFGVRSDISNPWFLSWTYGWTHNNGHRLKLRLRHLVPWIYDSLWKIWFPHKPLCCLSSLCWFLSNISGNVMTSFEYTYFPNAIFAILQTYWWYCWWQEIRKYETGVASGGMLLILRSTKICCWFRSY